MRSPGAYLLVDQKAGNKLVIKMEFLEGQNTPRGRYLDILGGMHHGHRL
jgi:hypothetical protein